MHITLDHKTLTQTLETVARVSTKHLTLPVLQCVLLEVKDKKLTLRATNLDIGIEGVVDVSVTEEGVVGVSAATLLQTVSLLTEKEVVLKTEGETLCVETKGTHATLTTMPTEEFPYIPRVAGEGQVLQGNIFALGIKTAAFAVSQSSIKPELGSVYLFQKKEQALTFVATDSFRLIEKTVPQQRVALDNGILIPGKNAQELARVCEQYEEDPTLYLDENQCAIEVANIYITSRLTAGTFPDYEQIIPKEYTTHTTLLTEDLRTALKKTGVFLNKFLQLTIAVLGNTATLTSRGDAGATSVAVTGTTEGDDITLNFNQRYVNDILGHISDDSLTIHFAGIGRPIVIEGAHDRSLRYLVMPMNK